MLLKNKNAIIYGGGGVIGGAVARAFAREAATVFLVGLDRLPGLKFMRTLWVCEVTGGPFKFPPPKPGKTHLGLEETHRDLKISSEEFDEVAAELGRSLDFAKVPAAEKGEVLAAFAAHKKEVTAGSMKK